MKAGSLETNLGVEHQCLGDIVIARSFGMTLSLEGGDGVP